MNELSEAPTSRVRSAIICAYSCPVCTVYAASNFQQRSLERPSPLTGHDPHPATNTRSCSSSSSSNSIETRCSTELCQSKTVSITPSPNQLELLAHVRPNSRRSFHFIKVLVYSLTHSLTLSFIHTAKHNT